MLLFLLQESRGRGGQIRTADLSDPNRARYQTALRPGNSQLVAAEDGLRAVVCQGYVLSMFEEFS